MRARNTWPLPCASVRPAMVPRLSASVCGVRLPCRPGQGATVCRGSPAAKEPHKPGSCAPWMHNARDVPPAPRPAARPCPRMPPVVCVAQCALPASPVYASPPPPPRPHPHPQPHTWKWSRHTTPSQPGGTTAASASSAAYPSSPTSRRYQATAEPVLVCPPSTCAAQAGQGGGGAGGGRGRALEQAAGHGRGGPPTGEMGGPGVKMLAASGRVDPLLPPAGVLTCAAAADSPAAVSPLPLGSRQYTWAAVRAPAHHVHAGQDGVGVNAPDALAVKAAQRRVGRAHRQAGRLGRVGATAPPWVTKAEHSGGAADHRRSPSGTGRPQGTHPAALTSCR